MWDVYAERARPSAVAFDCWRHGTEVRRQRSEVRGRKGQKVRKWESEKRQSLRPLEVKGWRTVRQTDGG